MKPSLREVYDPAVLMWYELCPEHTRLFSAWRDAPNPGPWNRPEVQRYPQLMAFLASCRVLGPSPQEWAETVAWQLLGIRRDCTRRCGKPAGPPGAEDISLPA